jgi:high-affinity iron transporter
MTVLQVTAYLAYLVVVIPAFVNAGRAVQPVQPVQPERGPAPEPVPGPRPVPVPAAAPARWERVAGRRPWAVAGVLVVVPALAAGVTIAAMPATASGSANAVTVTRTECAPEFTAAEPGNQTFTVANNSGLAGEINLDNASGAVVGEIETLGPGTSAPLTADLGNGSYTFVCLMGSQAAADSQTVQVSATTKTAGPTPVAVKPVTLAELTGPNKLYQAYAAGQLKDLARDIAKIRADLGKNDMARAKSDWLAAQLDWERVGASYDSFGDLGVAVDSLPGGLPGGVNDKNFTGLHRIEYGLWAGQPAAELIPVVNVLAKNVATVQKNLTSDDLAGDPTQLPLRVHEIIEDALRDHLSGADDEGAGAAYAMTYADTQVDRVVLGEESALINARDPGLVATAETELNTLDSALLATRTSDGQWPSLTAVTLGQRQHVDAAIGALLETLATVPDLLELPPTH